MLAKTISLLDVRCRENAMREASSLSITQNGAYLFINVCPEVLVDPVHSVGITDKLAERYEISKENIILELTEESYVQDYKLFRRALMYYREAGYKIAIDDFGAGYGGLKMLSELTPDFVKIDRYFISGIDTEIVKFNLVDAIVVACHKLGIRVVAEGIERKEELKTAVQLGIDLLQGYYLHKPSPEISRDKIAVHEFHFKKTGCCPADDKQNIICGITHKCDSVRPSLNVTEAFGRFINDDNTKTLPVVENGRIVGVLHRTRFLETNILGKYGFGMHLNSKKIIAAIMQQPSLTVESDTAIEDVAQRVYLRDTESLYDDICVTKNGKYYGIVSVSTLLNAVTERSLALARNANPLTGLAGNESIQREIDRRLSQNEHFDICYIDIDNFKPYNDHYGFEKGDFVIKTFADILKDTFEPTVMRNHNVGGCSLNFVGHIGGDDFIVITSAQNSVPLSEKIIANFVQLLPQFHGTTDYNEGFYESENRKGGKEAFSLLSISIGIVNTEALNITSYAHLASAATDVKKAAKAQKGSSIIKNKRTSGGVT